jgi:putative endonuclease
MGHRKRLGNTGEHWARQYLIQNGYQILEHNWRYSRYGELDIIAYHPQQQRLSFIEVKTRTTANYGTGLETLSPRQQHKIRFLAEVYLGTHAPQLDPLALKDMTMDLITVTPPVITGDPPTIQQYPNVF